MRIDAATKQQVRFVLQNAGTAREISRCSTYELLEILRSAGLERPRVASQAAG
jgi:hypothetical protein